MIDLSSTMFFIPARGGSKGIKNKNLFNVLGKPLIYYTLDICKELNVKPFISTDSIKILNACSDYGYKPNYKRPKSLAQDDSKIIDCVFDAIDWLNKTNKNKFDKILLLQPTNPIRKKEWIDWENLFK